MARFCCFSIVVVAENPYTQQQPAVCVFVSVFGLVDAGVCKLVVAYFASVNLKNCATGEKSYDAE
jgi:hypothetical protein